MRIFISKVFLLWVFVFGASVAHADVQHLTVKWHCGYSFEDCDVRAWYQIKMKAIQVCHQLGFQGAYQYFNESVTPKRDAKDDSRLWMIAEFDFECTR